VAEDTDNDVDDPLTPPALRLAQIVVTITRVDARVDDVNAKGDDDDWTTLALTTRTVDLLALPSSGFASLGITQLPAGGVERLRLFVSVGGPNYVVTADGQSHPLVVPSGEIRVVGDFDAEQCAVGQVTLALAGRASIEVHPLGDDLDMGPSPDAALNADAALRGDASTDAAFGEQWVLRPVVRVSEAAIAGAPCGDDGRGHGHGDDGKHEK
jgi:hypothetical protein